MLLLSTFQLFHHTKTSSLRGLIQIFETMLNALRCRLNKHPTSNIQTKYKNCSNLLQTKISSAKANFESNLISSFTSSNSSKIYKYIRLNPIQYHLHYITILYLLLLTLLKQIFPMTTSILFLLRLHLIIVHLLVILQLFLYPLPFQKMMFSMP